MIEKVAEALYERAMSERKVFSGNPEHFNRRWRDEPYVPPVAEGESRPVNWRDEWRDQARAVLAPREPCICDHGTDPKTLTTCNLCDGTGERTMVEFAEVEVPGDGLTDEERVVSDALFLAFTMFEQLERQHYDELRDFADGIHACQSQLMWRIVRRAHPEAWPIKRADSAPEQEVSDG